MPAVTAPPVPLFDEHISRGVQWFYRSSLDNDSGCGWSHYAGNQLVTEWGGTLDGIRGLLYAGENRHQPVLGRAIDWIKSRQCPDGGWLSWEIQQSCVEVTGWVIITLRQAGEDLTSAPIVDGCSFLERAQATSGGWGTSQHAEARIYPSLLAIWALSGVNDAAAGRGTKWLLDAVNADGGWGFHPQDQLSNISMTAMVLYVLLRTGRLVDRDIKASAVKWIKAHRLETGLWEPVFEDWVNFEDPKTKQQLPTRTSHFSSPWAIMALLRAGDSIMDPAMAHSITALVETQELDGSWAYVPYDQNRHTWCTANGLWALVEAKNAILSPAMYFDSLIQERSDRAHLTALLRLLFLLSVTNSVLMLGLLIYLSGVYYPVLENIPKAWNTLSEWVRDNAGTFIIATISTAIGTYLVMKKMQGSD